MNAVCRARRHGRGQALVEFALVFPLIVLLLLAVFDLGRYIFADNEISNAAREGVRTAIVNQYKPDIRKRAADQAIALNVSTTDPTTCDSANEPSDSSGICIAFVQSADPGASPCPTVTVGCVAVVTVKTTYEALTPIIGSIVGPRALVSTSKQLVESTCDTNGCPVP